MTKNDEAKNIVTLSLLKNNLPVRTDEHMLLSGAWRKMIHDKIIEQKITWHCPFKNIIFQYAQMSICNCQGLGGRWFMTKL
jgi:hypothetical protein